MHRPWRLGPRAGPRERAAFLGVALVLLGLGWVFGSRLYAIVRTEKELERLALQQAREQERIAELRQRLAEADRPEVIEREARLKLHWGYPDEERIILIRR